MSLPLLFIVDLFETKRGSCRQIYPQLRSCVGIGLCSIDIGFGYSVLAAEFLLVTREHNLVSSLL